MPSFQQQKGPFGRSPGRRRGAHRRVWISSVAFGEGSKAGRNYGLRESGMQQLLARETMVAADVPTVRPTKKSAMRKDPEVTVMPKGNPKMKPGPKFPMLDQGVVAGSSSSRSFRSKPSRDAETDWLELQGGEPQGLEHQSEARSVVRRRRRRRSRSSRPQTMLDWHRSQEIRFTMLFRS